MQRRLHLISLSNYVFVLEISQISGIARNVSALIKVVMRIVMVVGGRGRKRGRRTGERESCLQGLKFSVLGTDFSPDYFI